LILSAIRQSQAETLSFWDSLIIGAALASHAERLLSEDLQHGRVIKGMRIENPFVDIRSR
jgi:predicted nucleic acid-binding protein